MKVVLQSGYQDVGEGTKRPVSPVLTASNRPLHGLLRVLQPRHNEVSNNMSQNAVDSTSFPSGRPVVFRNATVLTIDPALGMIERGDVLVVDDRIAEVGRQLTAPDSAVEIDASGGILMPGMIDTHRHMWQTALRGYGADWTLTNYFQFYYLNWGKIFRPEDIYAGNLLSAIEAVDAGVTTAVDWSHGLQTVEYADAAVDALEAVPGRFVLAYGNLLGAPWEWTRAPEFADFIKRRIDGRGDMLRMQIAFDVTGDPAFPEKAAFEVARDFNLPVTTHAGVWGVTKDDSIRMMYDHGFMTPSTIYVHAASLSDDSYQRIAATGGHASVSAESEDNAGQGYPPTWKLRRHNIPVSLSMDTSVWWSADLFSAMRATLNADRAREHMEAHKRGETVMLSHLRAEQVVAYATIGGAEALGMDNITGSITPGKKADLVLIKNDRAPAMFPVLHPYGHVVFQAGRGDVHTVVVDGKVVKYDHRLIGIDLEKARQAVAKTVEYARSKMGEQAWNEGMNPEKAEVELIENPYTYTHREGANTGQEQE
ncbi:MAG TPA: amidohydrolase family protein [Ktedonobacteraceae bacterium]|nr:amidohydrolase family protein [Ktedonobacteraceae bacterium]